MIMRPYDIIMTRLCHCSDSWNKIETLLLVALRFITLIQNKKKKNLKTQIKIYRMFKVVGLFCTFKRFISKQFLQRYKEIKLLLSLPSSNRFFSPNFSETFPNSSLCNSRSREVPGLIDRIGIKNSNNAST